MGENKNDQKYEPITNVQPPIYGSEPEGGYHNRLGTTSESQMTDENYDQSDSDASMKKQPIRGNQQNQDIKNRDENSSESQMSNDDYEKGEFNSRSQLNEMEDDKTMFWVEGDDEDILGETENSQRNQQRMREADSNRGRSQDR